jgi:hypothetical protein
LALSASAARGFSVRSLVFGFREGNRERKKGRKQALPKKEKEEKEKEMDRVRVGQDGVHYERDGRAHLILSAPEGGQVLAVRTQQTDGTVRTIKNLDFGSATGATVRLETFATIGDKVLIGQDAGAADGSETDAAYRYGYGVIDFHEGSSGAKGDFSVSNDIRVDGDVHATSFVSLSDARSKEHIEEITESESALVHLLRPVTYTMRATGHRSAGLIAQELEHVFPRAVREYEGVKTVDYFVVYALLLAETQRLAKRLAALESRRV